MEKRMGEKPFVGVLCDISSRMREKYVEAAREVGRQIGTAGYGVAYNAGGGPMGNALASTAMHAGSPVIGVIPRQAMNQLLEERSMGLPIGTLHVVDTPAENARVLDTFASVYVVLPGGIAIVESILNIMRQGVPRPLILVDIGHFFSGLTSQLERCISSGFLERPAVNMLKMARDVDEISEILERELHLIKPAL
ncbi:Conserved hypothetical protein CHP00730 [Actinobacteria bacterium OV450]|nr:Conserved hypothetical protein CHP00730 [Actinobacteria bacterium OV450]